MVNTDFTGADKRLLNCQRIVVKIGSSLLTADGAGLDQKAIAAWAKQIATLAAMGKELVVVSSGAVAEGMVRLQLSKRPDVLSELQACAAIGQMGLVEAWASALLVHNVHSAQVLLTHEELTDRKRYLNVGSTLRQLIDWKVIPVINENDTLATEEISFGDNDTLSAMVAGITHADLLVILTDQQGMFDSNPRTNPDAKLMPTVRAMDEALFAMAGGGGTLGRGGMVTKVQAARLAATAGIPTIIASGQADNVLCNVVAGEIIGTLLTADQDRLAAKKQWIAAHIQPSGRLVLDDGAVSALVQKGASLLPIGVVGVEGSFSVGDVVECVNQAGMRVAAGIVNFDSTMAQRIKQSSSSQIHQLLGGSVPADIIHRDNMVVDAVNVV